MSYESPPYGSSSYELPFDVPAWDFGRAMKQLRAALRFGICPMIESVQDMLAELAHPDLHYSCVQIAGTNGKSSTARYTAAILRGVGLRVALYTSPELIEYNERIELDGVPVALDVFAHGIAAAQVAGERVNARRLAAKKRPYDITEFDLLTIAAFVICAEAGVDVVVLECGLGGRWDATSATKSIRSVAVTGIGLDHTRVLGDTLEAIAAEKAAVIKSGSSCVLGVGCATPDTVEDVFLRRCHDERVKPTLIRPERLIDAQGEMRPGVPRSHADLPKASYVIRKVPASLGDTLVFDLRTPRAIYEGIVTTKPAYQAANIACAVVLSENFVGHSLDVAQLRVCIAHTATPGRFEVVRKEPLVLVDACHNPQSVATFLCAMRQIYPDLGSRPALLCAVLADKDVAGIVALLAPEFPEVVCTQVASPRSLAAKDLAEAFSRAGCAHVIVYPSVREALAALSGAGLCCVACGSIRTAGEAAAAQRATAGL